MKPTNLTSHEHHMKIPLKPPLNHQFSRATPPWAPLAVVAAHARRPGKTREMAGILWGIQGDTMGIKWDVTEYHGYLTENHGIEWWIISDHIGYFLVSNGVFFLGYNGIQRDFMDSMGCNGDIFNEYHWSFHGVGISCVKIPMEILWAFFEA